MNTAAELWQRLSLAVIGGATVTIDGPVYFRGVDVIEPCGVTIADGRDTFSFAGSLPGAVASVLDQWENDRLPVGIDLPEEEEEEGEYFDLG